MFTVKMLQTVTSRIQSSCILVWLPTHLFKKLNTRKIIVATAIAVLLGIGFYQINLSPNIIYSEPLDNILCHYTNTRDIIPSADDATFSPPPGSIFFLETSCKGDLDTRQACAVESAARAHPNWQINVLFTAPVSNFSLNTGTLAQLRKFSNVKFARVHLLNYVKGTPLESLVARGAFNRSLWPVVHTSDALRYLTLYKWGGVYLDLDVIVAKSLEHLPRNWAARESDTAVAAGALAFSTDKIGRQIAEATLRDLRLNYRGDVWGHNAPGVITRVLRQLCSTSTPNLNEMSADTCKGFEVYGPQFFYPIKWEHARVYFEPGTFSAPNAYAYHVWNHLTQQNKVVLDSPYANLAKNYCTTIFTTFGNNFGK